MTNQFQKIFNKIPSRLISMEDFPYFEDYTEYVIDFVDKISAEKVQLRPKVKLVDSPWPESRFLSTLTQSLILIDIKISLIMLEVNKALSTGEVTGELWEMLLALCAHTDAKFNSPDAAYVMSILKRKIISEQLEERILYTIEDPENEQRAQMSTSIRVQEMFILAHELMHFFMEKNILNTERASEIVKDDLLQGKGIVELGDIEFAINLLKLELLDNELPNDVLPSIDSLLENAAFREEMMCDLLACEIAFDYFTWDVGAMSHDDVGASLQYAVQSLYIVSNLQNQVLAKLNHEGFERRKHELFVRMQIVNKYVQKKIITERMVPIGATREETEFNIIDFLVVHQPRSYKRMLVIDTFNIQVIINYNLMSEIGAILTQEVKFPYLAALYLLGFNLPEVDELKYYNSEEFQRVTDQRYLEEAASMLEYDFFQIDGQLISYAEKIMGSVFW